MNSSEKDERKKIYKQRKKLYRLRDSLFLDEYTPDDVIISYSEEEFNQDNLKEENSTTFGKVQETMMDIIMEEEHAFFIPEILLNEEEIYALKLYNPLVDKYRKFIQDVREYTEMVAWTNIMSNSNCSTNIQIKYTIIKPKELEYEIINKYGQDVYNKISSKDFNIILGIISNGRYTSHLLDLEYLVSLFKNNEIKCYIDYNRNIINYNIQPSKEFYKRPKNLM